jgi:GH24 family phage-related lysozyme (muramidase)
MIRAILRRGDGIGERVWLQTVVRHVQEGLAQAGHPIGADGKFGSDTEAVVLAFQDAMSLGRTGLVDRPTWEALSPYLEAKLGERERLIANLLPAFQGDPEWVHQQEGHRGGPYWPGGQSGVTLDPGVDLGHADPKLVERLYVPLLTPEQKLALTQVLGMTGERAKQGLADDPILRGIRISSDQSDAVMPYAAQPYWNGISERFASLKAQTTPAAVQTVFLSLAYNRGVQNRDLDSLRDPLSTSDWTGVADAIGRMQQDHELEGIRLRRRLEAALVLLELDYLRA